MFRAAGQWISARGLVVHRHRIVELLGPSPQHKDQRHCCLRVVVGIKVPIHDKRAGSQDDALRPNV